MPTQKKTTKRKPEKQTVLVTGASGFIAKHCIVRLLKEGYKVRGSLRGLSKEDDVRAAVAIQAPVDNLSFIALDLMSDAGWEEAMDGCQYVMHVASPFPNAPPKHEDELIIPAREGALRALRAAAKAGVKRTVLTSSMAAIAYGHDRDAAYIYTEDDWTNIDGDVTAYVKSKTIAERAAWDFMKTSAANGMELSVINPGAVLGPLLDEGFSTSGELVRKFLDGEVPACPNIGFSCIDVRDIADAHFAAMTKDVAAGRRYLCIGEYAWMLDISKILYEAGYKTSLRKLPNFMVHLIGIFDKTLRLIKGGLDKEEKGSNVRLRAELGVQPRPLEDMVLSMAKTMVEFGVVRPKMR